MDEPRDHVIRESVPWRDDRLTECGRPLSDVGSAVTQSEFQSRLKKYGRQRTAFTVCMTCFHHPHDGWDVDPVGVLRRDRTGYPIRESRGYVVAIGQAPLNHELVHELHAIAKLVDVHRGEFDRLVAEEKAGAEWREKLAAKKKRKA